MKKCTILLGHILCDLAKKELQVKLLVGYQDSLNGYGWHVKYYVELIQCIEFCPTCRAKYGVDYYDNQYPIHHQHKNHQEYKTIFTKSFISEEDMVDELKKFL